MNATEMNETLHIAWKGLTPSEALEARIRAEAGALTELYDRIVECRVVVEHPNRHHRHGGHYHVKLELAVPNRRLLVVSRDPEQHHKSEDAHVAVAEAFAAVRRQLKDFARVIRGDVKSHSAPGQGLQSHHDR